MIRINLLPEEYRKERIDIGGIIDKYKSTYVTISVIAGVALAFILILFLVIYPAIRQMTLKRLEAKWGKIEKDYNEASLIKKEYKELQNLLEGINSIAEERILWAKRLNDISDSLPSEIQLVELATKIEKTKDKSDRMFLVISGIVPQTPGELAIGTFVKNLGQNADFVKDFPDIEPPSTETTKEGFKKFAIKCYMQAVVKETAESQLKSRSKVKTDENI